MSRLAPLTADGVREEVERRFGEVETEGCLLFDRKCLR